MKKIRLTRVTVIEYKPDAKYYPEGSTIEQMAQIDANSDYIEDLFSNNIESDKVTWEVYEDTKTISKGESEEWF